MSDSVKDWLWRLDQIEKEMARVIPASNLHIAFALKLDDPGVHSSSELESLPFGLGLGVTGRPLCTYRDPTTGALWFDLGGAELPFAVCWDDETGWTVSDDMPEVTGSLGWCVWYYLEGDRHGEQSGCAKVMHRLFEIQAATMEACAVSPATVITRVGNLGELDSWPTALSYLAMKGHQPLIQAFGHDVPKHGPGIEPGSWVGCGWVGKGGPKTAWNRYNDRYIKLSPDLRTATGHAFDLFRRIAESTTDTGGESAQADSGQEPPSEPTELTLDAEHHRVRPPGEGEWFDLSGGQWELFKMLYDAQGGWVGGKNLPAARPDKTIGGIPLAVRKLIESKNPNGYRIPCLLQK